MPRWVVTCPKCRSEFTHTLVRDLTQGSLTRDVFASPPKPPIPDGGSRLDCPNCGGNQAYQISDLRYRAV
jgi:hypothetical protein